MTAEQILAAAMRSFLDYEGEVIACEPPDSSVWSYDRRLSSGDWVRVSYHAGHYEWFWSTPRDHGEAGTYDGAFAAALASARLDSVLRSMLE